MQDFPEGSGGQARHDHFFAAFGKFGAVTKDNTGRLLADVANTAAGSAFRQFEQRTLSGATA